MEWTDVIALDVTVTPIAFRVACAIGVHFNRSTGKAYPSVARIAKLLAVSERTVWAAVQILEARGYLIVERRELGFRGDGRRVCGGRGVANSYRPAFERSQLTATFSGGKLATRCDLLLEQRSQSSARKVAAHCVPTLDLPSVDNPAVTAKLELLRSKLGEDVWRLCCTGLEVEVGPPLALIVPRKYQKAQLQGHGQLLHDALGDFRLVLKGEVANAA